MLFGAAGTHSSTEALREWVLGGCDKSKFPALPADNANVPQMWVINRNGTILKFEDSPYPLIYHDKTFAEGSGRDFAYGAMAMGADAVTAVRIASRYDVFCGRGVDVISFDE